MRCIAAYWLCFTVCIGYAQPITGVWQVVNERHCLGNEMSTPSETEDEVVQTMTALSGESPKVIQFNADYSGEQELEKYR